MLDYRRSNTNIPILELLCKSFRPKLFGGRCEGALTDG